MKSAVFCLPLLFFFISISAAFATFQNNGDGTVTDSQTGLIWQKTPSTETKNWQEALAACADLTLAGQSDWRLPNRNELQSIVDYRYADPAIDSRSFPDVLGGNFWTSTTNVFASPSYAYTVDFTSGAVSSYDKASNSFQLLAVRGGPQPEPEETFFHDNGDGTVTDSRTGLVWLKAPLDADNDGNADAVTWQEALAKAVASISAGFTDWRLPNRNELQSIIDYSWHYPAIDSHSFPDVLGGNFWTSTTNTFASPSYAYTVDFTSGAVSSYDKAGNSFQVLFVREKQHDPLDSSSKFFKFTGIPSAIPAAAKENTPFAIEVFANDSSFNGTINLSIQDGGGVNPASVSLVNGHWQGNISVTRPGQTRLIALYNPLVGDLLSGSSQFFYVAEDQNAETGADLQLTITKNKAIFRPNDDVTYNIYVENLSADASPEAVIDATWSQGLVLDSVICSGADGAVCQEVTKDASSVKFKTSIAAGRYAHIKLSGKAREGFESIMLSAQTYDVQVYDPLVSNNSAVATLQTDIPNLPGNQTSKLLVTYFGSNPQSNADTVVLTHGLQEMPCKSDELWTSVSGLTDGDIEITPKASYLIRKAIGQKQINIYQFFWQGACHVNKVPDAEEYKAARQNVYFAAQQLAEQLFDKLGPNYDKKIHFIGHSLGTAVNAYAADMFLNKETKVSQAQVTILDAPNNIGQIPGFDKDNEQEWRYDENFFAAVLPFDRIGLSLYVDNYYAGDPGSGSGVGSAITGNVFNRLLVDPYLVGDKLLSGESVFSIDNDHSGVQQWYRWTMWPHSGENFSGDSVCPNSKWNKIPADFNDSLNPCSRPDKYGGWQESILLHDLIDFPLLNGKKSAKTNSTAAETSISSPHGCNAPAGNFVATVCTEAGAPSPSTNNTIGGKVASLEAEPQIPKSYIEFTVTVPELLRYMIFDYKFSNIGDGDYVYIFLDGVPVWKMSGDGLTAGETISSGLIPVRVAAGQKKLIIALYGVGEQNTQFSLNNFKFTTVADTDGDGVADDEDAFPNDPSEWLDSDQDGIGNNADPDDDNDGVTDSKDAFPLDPSEWSDTDGDGQGDNADLDDDNDGVADTTDNCPLVYNPNQADENGDSIGDACDTSPPNDGKWPLPAVLKLLLHR
ncbi:MAG: Lcl domain-containing protein [Candidatus Electronema sp. VV]